ncbi:unnamed protein product [Auanema sp. JU1783]|nr:unnamed protein product [Auanema sp. JU1783]
MALKSEGDFIAALTDFVENYNKFSKEKWTLHKSNNGIFAKQSVMIKWREIVVNRQVHITYSSVYGVPSLWFNIYRRDGIPLTADESLELSKHVNNNGFLKNMTQNEHPYLGLLFYNIHPCRTEKVMEQLSGTGNFIAKWLSVYGAPIGVEVPLEMFNQLQSDSSKTDEKIEA